MREYHFQPSDDHPDEAHAIARAQFYLKHFSSNHDDDDDYDNDVDGGTDEFNEISEFEHKLQVSVLFNKYAYGILLLAVASVCFALTVFLTHMLFD